MLVSQLMDSFLTYSLFAEIFGLSSHSTRFKEEVSTHPQFSSWNVVTLLHINKVHKPVFQLSSFLNLVS